MATIVLEHATRFDLTGVLDQLDPQKAYYVSIQSLEERDEAIKRIEEIFASTPKDTKFAKMTEEEIMEFVDQEIQANRQKNLINS